MHGVSTGTTQNKIIPHEITGKPWEIGSTDTFIFHNSHFLCIVNKCSQFPIFERADGLSIEQLIKCFEILFAKYQLKCMMILYATHNYISDKFKTFYLNLRFEQGISPSYNHQSDSKAEACINSKK